MALLEGRQAFLMLLDGRLELFDVLGASLPESRLSLSVALLSLLRGGIDLSSQREPLVVRWVTVLTGLRPPLRLTTGGGSCEAEAPSGARVALSGSGEKESVDGVSTLVSIGSSFGTTSSALVIVTSDRAIDPILAMRLMQCA